MSIGVVDRLFSMKIKKSQEPILEYDSPEVTIIDVQVEQGFAASNEEVDEDMGAW